MATRELLSGSTDGKGIKITQTATAGDTVHTAHATSKDHIYLQATNEHTAAVTLTLEFGGVTVPDNTISFTLQSKQGLEVLLDGLPLTNSLVLAAFASVANKVVLYGYVNRV